MTKPSPLPVSADTPVEIHYSVRKLLVSWEMGIMAMYIVLSVNMWELLKNGQWKTESFWFTVGLSVIVIGLVVLCALAIVIGTIPLARVVRRISRPALTISKEGLLFIGGPVIRWSQIEENEWLNSKYHGDQILIKVQSPEGTRPNRPLVIRSRFFKCSREQYLSYCNFYQTASNN